MKLEKCIYRKNNQFKEGVIVYDHNGQELVIDAETLQLVGPYPTISQCDYIEW